MNRYAKAIIVVVLIGLIGAVFALKQRNARQEAEGPLDIQGSSQEQTLPKLVELGSVKCQACKAMEGVLEELREDYPDTLNVSFVDVWENPEVAKQTYAIRVIPTQVFLDPQGRELFRHEGFFSTEDIVAKWKELGYDLTAAR